MHCNRVKLPDGAVAIVCGRRGMGYREGAYRCNCGAVAHLQCDWKTVKPMTCDRWLCSMCAQEVGPDKHLCPEHQAAYQEWLARRASREKERAS